MNNTVLISIGFALAVISIVVIRKVYPEKDYNFWGLGLVIAALIYVVFAIVGGAHDYLLMELGGVLLYGIFAYLSVKHHLLWLAVGWALHIGWDVWLHSGDAMTFVPAAYPALCIGFDIAIAGYIGWVVWGRRRMDSAFDIQEKSEVV